MYKPEFGNFSRRRRRSSSSGGQKGVQRPVLPPGTLVPIHPVAFMVHHAADRSTASRCRPSSSSAVRGSAACCTPESFGLTPEQLRVVVIAPRRPASTWSASSPRSKASRCRRRHRQPARRLRRHRGDGARTRRAPIDSQIIDVLLGSKNTLHNNYQDFQAFLDNGGKIGLQHDPLLYGAYLLNPFLVRVEMVPMLVVNQGEVAVIKAYVGPAHRRHVGRGVQVRLDRAARPPRHLAGAAAHRQVPDQPARATRRRSCRRRSSRSTGPTRCRRRTTSTRTCRRSTARAARASCSSIDLQVQIHVPDTKAPKVISMVGTMQNLVNEVLQAAVGNHFRNTLQALEAVQLHRDPRSRCRRPRSRRSPRTSQQYEVETQGRLHPGRRVPGRAGRAC